MSDALIWLPERFSRKDSIRQWNALNILVKELRASADDDEIVRIVKSLVDQAADASTTKAAAAGDGSSHGGCLPHYLPYGLRRCVESIMNETEHDGGGGDDGGGSSRCYKKREGRRVKSSSSRHGG